MYPCWLPFLTDMSPNRDWVELPRLHIDIRQFCYVVITVDISHFYEIYQ